LLSPLSALARITSAHSSFLKSCLRGSKSHTPFFSRLFILELLVWFVGRGRQGDLVKEIIIKPTMTLMAKQLSLPSDRVIA
jgi:hypothetical protein